MVITREYLLTRNIGEIPLIVIGAGLSLLAIPNPLVQLSFGIFFGFIPLFYIIYLNKGWKRFRSSLIFSEVFALTLLVPIDANKLIYSPDTLLIILVFAVIALIYSINFYLCAKIADKLGWIYSPLIFAIGWLMTQELLSTLPLTFAFPIETSVFNYPNLLQASRLIGGQAIGAFIIFINAALSYILIERSRRSVCAMATLLSFLLMNNLLYGQISIGRGKIESGRTRIAIIQTNKSIKEYYLSDASPLFNNYANRRLISLTKQALSLDPDIIIWPECSRGYVLQNDQFLDYLYKNITSKGPDLLIGTNFFDRATGRDYNVAFILQKDGNIKEIYKKERLVPLIETQIYSPSKERQPLSSSTMLRKIGTMICLESLYPRISKELVRNGAGALVCISTDASFGNSMIPYIHAAMMVFRAIENNKFAVHVGNTGPSLACDNKGRILTYIPYGKTAIGLFK